MTAANRQWRLKRRPSGQFDQADFELATVPVPEVRDRQFLVRLTHLSVDPTQRIWAHEESYLPIQPIGDVMRSIAVGVVERSLNAQFPAGTQVSGIFGAQEYAVSDGQGSALLTPHAQYLALGGTDEARRESYRQLFRSELDPDVVQEIRDATNGNFALGGERFKRQIEVMLGRRVSRGQRGRPRKLEKLSNPAAELFE